MLSKRRVHVEHGAPVFRFAPDHRAVNAQAGVVDQYVEGTEALDRFFDELLAGRVGDVGGDGEGGVSEFFGEVVQAVLTPGGEDGVEAC